MPNEAGAGEAAARPLQAPATVDVLARMLHPHTSPASALALTTACLDRIAARPDDSGFVRVFEEDAIATARQLDAACAKGSAKAALHGMPFAHKDMFFRAGFPSECGSRILRGYRPECTATVLERLAQAGAVTLGALHMAEFAMSPMGYNAHIGHGRNPWSRQHVSGGSSSGSGIAVASRAVFGALGSDTGGSIRIPAAACGVTGIKPTQYAISAHGVMPLAPSLDCVGFLARTAHDCARLLSVVSGPDPRDPNCVANCPQDYTIDLARPLTQEDVIAVPDFPAGARLSDEVRELVERAAYDLADSGATLRRVPMPDLQESGALATLMLGAEAASIHARWLSERSADYGEQVRRRLQRGLLYPATRYVDALRLRCRSQAAFIGRYLDGAVALLLPVLPEAVPTIEETISGTATEIETRFGDFSYWTRGINYLGLPAIAMPAGFTANGLPNGVQLVGRPFSEGILLRVAHWYQQITDWHQRTPFQ